MQVGYGRTSTLEQWAGLEAQERELVAAGCEKIFVEQLSATASRRPRLDEVLDFVREGDELVVTKLDRLARSVADLMEIEARLRVKRVGLRIIGSPIETATPTGRLMFQVLGAVAEFERALMLERQREGIAKAKAQGRYKGRKPTARAKAAEVLEMLRVGASVSEIVREVGISKASVYRIKQRSDGYST